MSEQREERRGGDSEPNDSIRQQQGDQQNQAGLQPALQEEREHQESGDAQIQGNEAEDELDEEEEVEGLDEQVQ